MQFLVLCYDGDGKLDQRLATRPAHLEYLGNSGTNVLLGGPILDDAGEKPIGSSLIVEAEDVAAVHAFCDQDPYFLEGVFEKRIVHPMRVVLDSKAES